MHRRNAHRLELYLEAPWLHGSWYANAICVHNGEGSWTANTGNGYYGGFQYAESTWISAGGLAFAPRADLASPAEQLHVTWMRTTRHGWGEWPSTARACGLI